VCGSKATDPRRKQFVGFQGGVYWQQLTGETKSYGGRFHALPL
jgi:hypothetical protein